MPTPPTPVITGPPSGSSHSGSVTFTIDVPSGGGGTGTPTAAIITPVEGAQLESGSYTLAQVQVTPNGNTITGVEIILDGAPVGNGQPMAFNATTGYWEYILSLATTTTLGARTLRAVVTYGSGSTVTSPTRNFTAVAGDTVVTDVAGRIDTRRAALSLADIPRTSRLAFSEFWRRLGNGDGELSTNRRANLLDAFIFRSDYNVGTGTEVYGFKGNTLTLGGTTATPTWGADFVSFSGQDSWADCDNDLLAGLGEFSVLAIVRAVNAATGTRAIVSQYVPGNTSAVGRVNCYCVNANTPGLTVGNSSGSAVSNDGEAGLLASRASFAAGFQGTSLHVQTLPGGADDTFASATLSGVTVPAGQLIIGNRETHATGMAGEYSIVLLFDVWDAVDLAAIHHIVAETIGAGLGV